MVTEHQMYLPERFDSSFMNDGQTVEILCLPSRPFEVGRQDEACHGVGILPKKIVR